MYFRFVFVASMSNKCGVNELPDHSSIASRACLERLPIVFIDIYNGGQGQNRTADTGIFRASKINNLLIMLKQGVFGTVGDSYVDSAG